MLRIYCAWDRKAAAAKDPPGRAITISGPVPTGDSTNFPALTSATPPPEGAPSTSAASRERKGSFEHPVNQDSHHITVLKRLKGLPIVELPFRKARSHIALSRPAVLRKT